MARKATVFKFGGYKIYPKEGEVIFFYAINFKNAEPLNFSETIVLPRSSQNLNKGYIHTFLKPLSLILGISYYKLYCPPKVELSFKLSKEEAEFWNTVY